MHHTFRKFLHYAVRTAASLFVWLVSFIILAQIPAFTEVVDGVNTINSPIPLLAPIALAVGVFFLLKKPLNNSKQLYDPSTFTLRARAYINAFSVYYGEALRAVSVTAFMCSWDCARAAHRNLAEISSKVPFEYRNPLPWQETKMQEFQWRLRDTIERAADLALHDLEHAHRNNQPARFMSFTEDIKGGLSTFSLDTRSFAGASIRRVASQVKIPLSDDLISLFPSNEPIEKPVAPTSTNLELFSIDTMEGHVFEHWCAALLKKIGYTDVQVTRGSGDQGVDVLAQKDGIKYAVQCKCYSSDLGNTPVQEVNAGKTIYHCHVGAVMTNRHFTKGAKEAADATGVLLWDRDWIINALSAVTAG